MLDSERDTLFRNWLDAHSAAVLKVARAYTLTAEDCQDLVQEILLQVWRSLPSFQGASSPATWSYRVALNTALNWRRNELRRRARPIGLEVNGLAGGSSAGDEQSTQRETVERLYAAIRQLPKADAALVLLYLEELSYREMSEVLGISESHVGVKLNRARKALAALLQEESDEA